MAARASEKPGTELDYINPRKKLTRQQRKGSISFFEKKKQKTFTSCARPPAPNWPIK
jgi:hypothetical protein